MIVTPIIQPFCSTFELHERAPIVLGVCGGHHTVEAVFRCLIRFHNVHVFASAFAFLVVLAFLCVAVVIGAIVERSSTWSPAVLRPMSSSATVLARVDTHCVARVARAISFRVLL